MRFHNFRRLGGNKLILDGADETLGFLQAQTYVPGLHLLQSTSYGQYSMGPGLRACICKLDRDEHPHSPLLAIAVLLSYSDLEADPTVFNGSKRRCRRNTENNAAVGLATPAIETVPPTARLCYQASWRSSSNTTPVGPSLPNCASRSATFAPSSGVRVPRKLLNCVATWPGAAPFTLMFVSARLRA